MKTYKSNGRVLDSMEKMHNKWTMETFRGKLQVEEGLLYKP